MAVENQSSDHEIALRPFREADLAIIQHFFHEREFSWPFEWSGYRSIEIVRSRFNEDGLLENDPQYLAITLGTETIGWVVWPDENAFNQGGTTSSIGIVLAPLHRGQGYGTTAQVMLRDYLFSTTQVNRIIAYTEVDNVAEQRALEKSGFRHEGHFMQAGWRDGHWRDILVYAFLRSESDAGPRPNIS